MTSPEIGRWTHTDGTRASRREDGTLWIKYPGDADFSFAALAPDNMTASKILCRLCGRGWGDMWRKRPDKTTKGFCHNAASGRAKAAQAWGRVAAYAVRAEKIGAATLHGFNPDASITDKPLTDSEILAALHAVRVVDLPDGTPREERQAALLRAGACLTTAERDAALASLGTVEQARPDPMAVPTCRWWEPRGRKRAE